MPHPPRAPRATLFCLASALLAPLPARAQEAPTPKPVDSARVVTALEALKTGGAVEAMIAAIRANLPAQRAATPQLPPQFWTSFEARIDQEAPRLADSIAVVYARHFTLAELKALVTFYQSPLGRKLRELQPTLVTESAAIGQRWGARIGAEVAAALGLK